MSICTLEEIKDWLKITDSSEDAFLTALQAGVEGAVKKYCDNDFVAVEKTEIIDGTRSDIIVLPGYPIISVDGIWFNCDGAGEGGGQLDVDDYTVREEGIYLRKGLYTPYGRSNVRVDYTYGFEEVPDEVKLAVKMGVEAFRARRARKTVGIASRGKEGENESFISAWDKLSGLPIEVTGLLGAYRDMDIPVIQTAQRNM